MHQQMRKQMIFVVNRELSGRMLDSVKTEGPRVRASPASLAHCVVSMSKTH